MPAKKVFQAINNPGNTNPNHIIKSSETEWDGAPPPNWEKKFFLALRSKPNLTFACRSCRVLRDYVVDKMNVDDKFKRRVELAIEEGKERLEEKMFDEACDGNTKYAELFMKLWRTGTPKSSDKTELIIGVEE
jgi:hypothetical protein